MTASPPPRVMPIRPLTCLLAALLLGLSAGAARAGTDAPAAVTALVCGAFVREPAPGEAWPTTKDVRPGEAVGATDRGLGCRFVVSGETGQAPVVVAVRLTRPLPEGGTAEDVWQTAARPGEPAVAAYALAAGLPVPAGEWTLTLTPPGGQPAVARFQVVGRPTEAAPPPAAMLTAQGAKAAQTAAAAPRPEPALPVAAAQAAPPAPAALATAAAPVVTDESNGQTAPPVSPAAAVTTTPADAAASVAPVEPHSQTAPPGGPAAARTTTPPPAAAPAGQANASAPPAPAARPGKTAPRQEAAPAAKANPAAGYLALQTGLFADADNAAAQAAKLRSQGLPACLAVSDKDGKRRYRVLAGRFGDRRAAAAARSAVMAATGVAPIVTPVAAGDIPGLRCR